MRSDSEVNLTRGLFPRRFYEDQLTAAGGGRGAQSPLRLVAAGLSEDCPKMSRCLTTFGSTIES
ncbi:hypothetical protein BIW11_06727 [Tropilaelaps mercedesae]|uniref:Uncharacterized protein n=1 Tax=Tropilaelaps mercedesae TaxID=418985 RepID=A0A1V9XWT0_9ACAR|nr:hypothetical protein BIW11_06727 [Tropilaelaps mercedesae]